jgi:tetratricopeptide (TPR) repeat protein
MNKKFFVVIIWTLALFPACAASRTGKLPEATGQPSRPAINIVESRAMYIYSLSRLHILEGDLDGALALLQAAIEADPDSAFLHTALANIYLKMNRFEDALAACEAAVKLDPNDVKAHSLAGSILAGLKRDKEAIPHFRKAIELDPSKEEIYLHLAVSYVRVFEY